MSYGSVLRLSLPIDPAAAGSPYRLPGLGLHNCTPAARRRLAGVYAGAAALGALGAVTSPSPAATAAILAATAATAGWAVEAWVDSRKRLYFNPACPPVARREDWQVLPGQEIGPFRLGPPASDALLRLRHAHAAWWALGHVTLVIRFPDGWCAVCLRTAAQTQTPDGIPDPCSLQELVWVETSSPGHATPEGIAPGITARRVAERLGPPLYAWDPVGDTVRVEYPGLRITIHRGTVRSLRVFEASPEVGAQAWNL